MSCAGDHGRLADGGVREERGLDLGRLDAEAADLELVVDPAQVVQGPVGQPPAQVAGAVQARAARGIEGVGEVAVGGERGLAVVAAGQGDSPEQQLAGHPDRHRLQPAVDDVGGRVGDRPSDRQRAIRPSRRSADGDLAGLRRAVLVVELGLDAAQEALCGAAG